MFRARTTKYVWNTTTRAQSSYSTQKYELQVNLALLKKKKEAVPEVEWWDVPFVGQEGYSRVDDGTVSKDKVMCSRLHTIYHKAVRIYTHKKHTLTCTSTHGT
jgi:hypothetical protein